MAERRAPGGGPVHHERQARGAPGREQRVRALEVRGHGLLDHHRQAAAERVAAQLRGRAVVGEHEDGVGVRAFQQSVVGRMRLRVAVGTLQALAQPRVGIGRGHEPPELTRGDRREVRPDVVMAEPEHSHSQSHHEHPPMQAAERCPTRSVLARPALEPPGRASMCNSGLDVPGKESDYLQPRRRCPPLSGRAGNPRWGQRTTFIGCRPPPRRRDRLWR